MRTQEKKDFCINRSKLRKLEHKGCGRIQAAQLVPGSFAGPILVIPAYVVIRQSGLCGESYIYQVSDQMSLLTCNDFWGRDLKVQAVPPKNRKLALLALRKFMDN